MIHSCVKRPRAHLQDELAAIVEETRSTVIMVTHVVDEAVLLSDRIVMLTNGPAATIGEVLNVTLPQLPRLKLMQCQPYHDMRAAVMKFLYYGTSDQVLRGRDARSAVWSLQTSDE